MVLRDRCFDRESVIADLVADGIKVDIPAWHESVCAGCLLSTNVDHNVH